MYVGQRSCRAVGGR